MSRCTPMSTAARRGPERLLRTLPALTELLSRIGSPTSARREGRGAHRWRTLTGLVLETIGSAMILDNPAASVTVAQRCVDEPQGHSPNMRGLAARAS